MEVFPAISLHYKEGKNEEENHKVSESLSIDIGRVIRLCQSQIQPKRVIQ
jgi:hypothetical protein